MINREKLKNIPYNEPDKPLGIFGNKKWITSNKKILSNFRRCPGFIDIYNRLVQYTRDNYLRKTDLLKTLEFGKSVTDKRYINKKSGLKHVYACFPYTQDLHDYLRYSQYSDRSIKLYRTKFVEIGLLEKICRKGGTWIYAIGFIVDGVKMKHHLLLRQGLSQKLEKFNMRHVS